MDIIDHNRNVKTFCNQIRYEENITKFGWIIILGLVSEDVFARIYLLKQSPLPIQLLIQGPFFILYIVISLFKLNHIKKERTYTEKNYKIIKSIEIVIIVTLISTLYHSIFFYFVVILPITLISLSSGFRSVLHFIGLSWSTQILSQFFMSFIFRNLANERLFWNNVFSLLIITSQYILYTIFCYIWGQVHSEYLRSEEEKNSLIDRLGDKYVQLEQAKKEVQTHYDKLRETNDQLEETNNKLSSSIAEFFTLQQISQAITSIVDMNELLKFVNDVIIGVMGAYHSTIALSYGSQNKLKVQVSTIFDKKDLAIVSDYINSEILNPSIYEGRSMINNAVNPEDYPFTRGRNIQSLICVPLLVKGKTVGIVIIEHSIKDAFNDNNVRLLEIITQQVSIAIENARLYQQMHDLATLDGLTGAYNRLYFQDTLEEETENAQEKGYDLSLIIFDIDHFKKFNDTYGHLFGDLVLKSISTNIMKTLRKEDIFARYGGEEFVVLMPHTKLEQAQEKAEELRSSISKLNVTDGIVSASVTVSVGVSSFPESSGRCEELIKTADDALYKAKHDGRNLVRVAQICVDME